MSRLNTESRFTFLPACISNCSNISSISSNSAWPEERKLTSLTEGITHNSSYDCDDEQSLSRTTRHWMRQGCWCNSYLPLSLLLTWGLSCSNSVITILPSAAVLKSSDNCLLFSAFLTEGRDATIHEYRNSQAPVRLRSFLIVSAKSCIIPVRCDIVEYSQSFTFEICYKFQHIYYSSIYTSSNIREYK